MFFTLEHHKALANYDYAKTRAGRLLGFIRIARANGLSWRQLFDIARAWNREAFTAVTSPHRPMFPNV